VKKNIILDKSLSFSLSIIELYKELIHAHAYVMSKQVLRSATSIGASIQEAQAYFNRENDSSKH